MEREAGVRVKNGEHRRNDRLIAARKYVVRSTTS
jgi:hypothetical protein